MTQIFQDSRFPRLFSLEECELDRSTTSREAFKPFRIGQDTLHCVASPMQVIGHPTIGLWIDGACRGNGTPSARGAYGVYFGNGSPFNCSGTVPLNEPQTSQRAEIRSALAALDQIEAVNARHPEFELFIVASDSAYLVNSITDYIQTWKQNGWRTSEGQDVANRDLWERLDTRLTRLSNQENDIDVLFWHVDRSQNIEADRLANQVLDRA